MMIPEEISYGDGVSRLNKYHLGPSSKQKQTPVGAQYGFYFSGRFLRLFVIYLIFKFLTSSETSIVLFSFFSLLCSSFIFLIIQKPWRGRTLLTSQWMFAIANGAVMSFSFIFFYYGLKTCGPLRTIFAEYSGVIIASFSTMAFGRRGNRREKLYGIICMIFSFYFLAKGWTYGSVFHLHADSTKISEKNKINSLTIIISIIAGLLSSLRRLLSRLGRTQAKKKLHSITVFSSSLFLFPFAMYQLSMKPHLMNFTSKEIQIYFLTIVFAIVFSYYIDSYAEEKLRLIPSSPKHLLFTIISILILEKIFMMDFSFIGFFLFSVLFLLGFYFSGLESKMKKSSSQSLDANMKEKRKIGLAKFLNVLFKFILHDKKSSRIALFLLINTSFMFVEFVYGFFSNSLGLISDACHMLFDCAALVIGLYASYISKLNSHSKYAYGYDRFEVLSGYSNAIFLILIAVLIVVESIERILTPPQISTEHILMVSIGGLIVNIIGLAFFHDAHHHAHGGSCAHAEHDHGHQKSCSHAHHEHEHAHAHAHAHAHERENEHECEHEHVHANHDHFPEETCSYAHHEYEHAHAHKYEHEHEHAHENKKSQKRACSHAHDGHAHDHVHVKHLINTHDHDHVHDHSHHSCIDYRDHENDDGHHHHHHMHLNDHAHESHDHSVSNDNHNHNHHRQVHHHHFQNQNQNQSNSSILESMHSPSTINSNHEHHDSNCMHKPTYMHAPTFSLQLNHSPELTNKHLQYEKYDERNERYDDQLCNKSYSDTKMLNASNGVRYVDYADSHVDEKVKHGQTESRMSVSSQLSVKNLLSSGNPHVDHNMHGIFLHVLADTLGSVGVVISTLLIKYKGWVLSDPVCSIFISILIISTVIPLLRNSAEVILQRVPRAAEFALAKIVKEVESLQGVVGQQQAHFWSFTPKTLVGSIHVFVCDDVDKQRIRRQVANLFSSIGVSHMTIQVEDFEFLNHALNTSPRFHSFSTPEQSTSSFENEIPFFTPKS